MSERLNGVGKFAMKEIAPGIWGREMPPVDPQAHRKAVEKLAREAGSKETAEFIMNLYFPPRAIPFREKVSQLLSRLLPK